MRYLLRLILFVVAPLLFASCSAPPIVTNTPTTEVVTDAGATPTETAGPEPTVTASSPSTLSPAGSDETATPPPARPTPTAVSATAVYGFQVSYTLETTPEDPAVGPSEGMRWFVVVAAIQNDSDQALMIGRESLTLIDKQGARYSPDEPSEDTQPPLVGTRIEAGEDLLGLVRFTIPEDIQPDALEWCTQGTDPCREPLTAPIP
jgi:hypothetical protein